MAVHPHNQNVQIAVVIIKRLHGQVKTPVFGDEMPWLHVFIRLREYADIDGPELMRLSVIENTGLRCFGFVADSPGYFKAEEVFFPFLIIYLQNYLGIDNYAIVLGVVLIVASAVSVLSGRFIDRFGKLAFTVPAAGIMLLGLLGMFLVRGSVAVILAGTVMMSGYMMLTAALSANIRDWTPGL